MDPLAGLLDGPRARGAFMLRACFDPPWSIRVEDRAPLTVMLMVRGDAWVTPDKGEPLFLRAERPGHRTRPGPVHLRRRPGDRAAGADSAGRRVLQP